jgi:hypothetical protein
MAEEQQIGSVILKVDEKSQAPVQVYKCPFLNCPAYFFNYQDLQQHKVLHHGEVPKFFFNDAVGHKPFSKARLAPQNLYVLKSRINHYKMMLTLMFMRQERPNRHKAKKKTLQKPVKKTLWKRDKKDKSEKNGRANRTGHTR